MKMLIYLCAGLFLSIPAGAQLQNLDFEQWENPVSNASFSNRPSGWKCTDGAAIAPDKYFYYPPAVDAQQNKYAIYLSVWYNYTKDAAYQTAPINSRPMALKGYYQYRQNLILGPNGIQRDTALIGVCLTKFNPVSQSNDTIGRGILKTGNSTNGYTAFNVDIEYTSTLTPDSISIYLDPSLVKRPGAWSYDIQGDTFSGHTSFFTVDNLSLLHGSTTGIGGSSVPQPGYVFPNPAREFIQLKNIQGAVCILDVTGRVIEKWTTVPYGKISVGHLQPGIYILKVNTENGDFSQRFVKQ